MRSIYPPYLGAAYYPENWPMEQIDIDIASMKKAGMNVMRIAEFAWSRMEPREGEYNFKWLHLVVHKLAQAGIAVIMSTPTCTPPVWLSEQYPEILFICGENGRPMRHGGRRHACPNNSVYREHCARIVTRLAEEFGQDDRIIGWQIDNEISSPSSHGRSCICPVCIRKFHNFMQTRFGSIEKLNKSWGTNLWSQTYQLFEQLPLPHKNIWHHPSLLVAWAEFTSNSYVEFVKHQTDILHRMARQPVGTDMMPYAGIDYGDMHHSLDIVQFNHYNSMENLWEAVFWFDLIRPIKQRPFWNTETSTCWNGSTIANGYKEPGFCYANSWLPLALGGEANLYWLWRQHWSGQELMHGAVLSSCGRPMHIIKEIQEISADFQTAADFLNTTRPTATGLALHYSHRAAWIFEYQPMVNGFIYNQDLMGRVYHPLVQVQLRPDVILPISELARYWMILSIFLSTLEEKDLRERLKNWIEAGGTWVVGPLSDIRTLHATKFKHAPYGSLEKWAGVRCRYEIPGDPHDFKFRWADGRESQGSIWYDGLELCGAEALATYTEGPFSGLATVTRHKMGKGQIIMLGTMPQSQDLQKLILSIGEETRIRPVAEASNNLLVVPRDGQGGKGLVVVELENCPAKLFLRHQVKDLLTGRKYDNKIDIKPYSVMVLKDL